MAEIHWNYPTKDIGLGAIDTAFGFAAVESQVAQILATPHFDKIHGLEPLDEAIIREYRRI